MDQWIKHVPCKCEGWRILEPTMLAGHGGLTATPVLKRWTRGPWSKPLARQAVSLRSGFSGETLTQQIKWRTSKGDS